MLQNLLPPRMLTDEDQVPFIKDISHLQNRAIIFIDGIAELNEVSDGRLEKVSLACLN